MADFLHRHPLNAEGKFYVDHTCTDCDFCCVLAPNNFGRDSDTAHYFLLNQPTTESELAEVREAVAACPTASIGDDGDSFVWRNFPTQYSGWWAPSSDTTQASKPSNTKEMKVFRYAPSAILLAFGASALICGGCELYLALKVDELQRIGLENALGEGNGPELFALRFIGIGLLAIILGWFDFRRTRLKNG